ncbi:hypothetical protein K432DRAFT_299455, partial [Lepidopterella palustris CBS 459.81]
EMAFPESHYTLPLLRCLPLQPSPANSPTTNSPLLPKILKLLRSRLGMHTRNRSSLRSSIIAAHSTFTISFDFSEEDELWKADEREAFTAHVKRLRRALDSIFADPHAGTFISCTVHSGTIRALYDVVGHADVCVTAGAVVPVFVKGERVVVG